MTERAVGDLLGAVSAATAPGGISRNRTWWYGNTNVLFAWSMKTAACRPIVRRFVHTSATSWATAGRTGRPAAAARCAGGGRRCGSPADRHARRPRRHRPEGRPGLRRWRQAPTAWRAVATGGRSRPPGGRGRSTPRRRCRPGRTPSSSGSRSGRRRASRPLALEVQVRAQHRRDGLPDAAAQVLRPAVARCSRRGGGDRPGCRR